MNFHITALYVGFILGNLLHTLYSAYQLVQVNKRFCCYKDCFRVLGIPVFVRTVIEVIGFGILMQNPGLTNWAVKLAATYLGDEFSIKLTGLSAFMLGFVADTILALLAQRYLSKYPLLVAQIPVLPNGGPVPATPQTGAATP